MSDRDTLLEIQNGLLKCHNYIVSHQFNWPIADEDAYWELTKGAFSRADSLLRELLRAAPVEPPVLSRAEMGKICDDLCAKSKTGLFGWPFVEELMDAIWESLSQEASE